MASRASASSCRARSGEGMPRAPQASDPRRRRGHGGDDAEGPARTGLDVHRHGMLRPLLPGVPARGHQRHRQPGAEQPPQGTGVDLDRAGRHPRRPVRRCQAQEHPGRQRDRAPPDPQDQGGAGRRPGRRTGRSEERPRARAKHRDARAGRHVRGVGPPDHLRRPLLPAQRADQGRHHDGGDQGQRVHLPGDLEEAGPAERRLGPGQRARARRKGRADDHADHLPSTLLGQAAPDRLREPGRHRSEQRYSGSMSRWPDDRGGRQPEGRRARHPEGRRSRGEGRRGRQAEGRHDPDDTLPWLTGLEEASSPEDDAEWAGKLRPRQAPRVDMPASDKPDRPPGAPGTELPAADWRAEDPAFGAPVPDSGEQMLAWTFDDEPTPAEEPGRMAAGDASYASWAHGLDGTAVWEPEPQDWADPPRAGPSWERPTAEPATRAWEPQEPWGAPPSAGTWDPEPRPVDDPAATRPWEPQEPWGAPPSAGTWDPEPRPVDDPAATRPWEPVTAPPDTEFGSLFADPAADPFADLQGGMAGAAAPEQFSARFEERPETEDTAFAAAQAEARRLVEQATTQSWSPEPSWWEEGDHTGIDRFTDEPVVSFGSVSDRGVAPAPPSGPTPAPPPAIPDVGPVWPGSPPPGPGPGRALEPAASSWDRPGPGPGPGPAGADPAGADPAGADPATQGWELAERLGAAGDEDWLWPVDREHEARPSGARSGRQAEGGQAAGHPWVTTIEGRRVRQLEGRSRSAPAGRPEGRRVRQRDSRVRRRWPLRVAILAWVVLFAVVCWLYIFPWLEGVLPENF